MHVNNFVKECIIMETIHRKLDSCTLGEIARVADVFPCPDWLDTLQELKRQGVVVYDRMKARLPQDAHMKVTLKNAKYQPSTAYAAGTERPVRRWLEADLSQHLEVEYFVAQLK